MIKEIKINPAIDLIFDNKVAESCKTCKRYGQKATCPPHIASIDYYRKLLPTYKFGKLFYRRFDVPEGYKQHKEEEDPNNLGRKSSLEIHTYLLKERDELHKEGHYFTVILGAGSCKLCVTCDFPCAFPSKSIMPMEGVGLNVIAMMAKFGFKITYPINNHFYRIGCILYD